MRHRLTLFVALASLILGPSASLADLDESVARETLANGLRVVVVRSPLAPVVTTVVSYLVGANDTPKDFPGMAHAVEHMMFRGSPGLSGPQLSKIAAALGGKFNAVTKQTVTEYFFTVPADQLEVVLRLEAIRMREALNSQALWEKERGAIQQEVAQYLSNPEVMASRKVRAALFEGTDYAHDPLGTPDSFERTTGTMLRAFHRAWYAPNNAVIVIAGDVEPEKVLGHVRNHFGRIPAKNLPRKTRIELKPAKASVFEIDSNGPNALLTISFRLPGSSSPDFAAARILCDVLGAKSGALHGLAAEGKALSVDFSFDPLPAASIGSIRAAFPRGSDGEGLRIEIERVLSSLVREGIAVEQVEGAKRRQILEAEIEKSSIWTLATAWARAIAIDGRASLDEGLEAIRRVKAEDVIRVARAHLGRDRAVVGVLTPRLAAAPTTSQAVSKVEQTARVPEVRSVSLPKWAAKAMQQEPNVASHVTPSVSHLPNGVELIVHTQPATRAVLVLGKIKTEASLQVPEGKEGVHDALGQLFEFGTTSLDRVAFQRALDEIGARESAGFDFSLRVLDEHFERGLELLADNLLRPSLREDSFQIVRRQLAESTAGRLQNPEYLSARALRVALLPKGDPRLRQTLPETVATLTLRDVRDYYTQTFRPDLTKIVVVGSISHERVEAVFAKHLSEWRAEGPTPEIQLPAVSPNKPSSTAVLDTKSLQSKVTLAQTLAINRSHPDYYALELGNRILVGALNATRLQRALRGETGLVYGVSSILDVRPTRAFFAVRFACDPANARRAREIVVSNLEQMQATLATPDEVAQARRLLLSHMRFVESSAEDIAQGLLERASERLPLDEPAQAARRYLALNAEQIRAAFATWLRPMDLAEVIEGRGPQ